MSVEQIEATIESMPMSEAQKAELLRRRREYDEHPERFVRLDAKGIAEMCERVNREVKGRLSSAS